MSDRAHQELIAATHRMRLALAHAMEAHTDILRILRANGDIGSSTYRALSVTESGAHRIAPAVGDADAVELTPLPAIDGEPPTDRIERQA